MVFMCKIGCDLAARVHRANNVNNCGISIWSLSPVPKAQIRPQPLPARTPHLLNLNKNKHHHQGTGGPTHLASTARGISWYTHICQCVKSIGTGSACCHVLRKGPSSPRKVHGLVPQQRDSWRITGASEPLQDLHFLERLEDSAARSWFSQCAQ